MECGSHLIETFGNGRWRVSHSVRRQKEQAKRARTLAGAVHAGHTRIYNSCNVCHVQQRVIDFQMKYIPPGDNPYGTECCSVFDVF